MGSSQDPSAEGAWVPPISREDGAMDFPGQSQEPNHSTIGLAANMQSAPQQVIDLEVEDVMSFQADEEDGMEQVLNFEPNKTLEPERLGENSNDDASSPSLLRMSYGATDRGISVPDHDEITPQDHLELEEAGGRENALRVDSESPSQVLQGLELLEKDIYGGDEDVRRYFNLSPPYQQEERAVASADQEIIIIDNDSDDGGDDSMLVPLEILTQPPNSLVRPKEEDEDELPPLSDIWRSGGWAQKRKREVNITNQEIIIIDDDSDDNSLFVPPASPTQPPSGLIQPKVEDDAGELPPTGPPRNLTKIEDNDDIFADTNENNESEPHTEDNPASIADPVAQTSQEASATQFGTRKHLEEELGAANAERDQLLSLITNGTLLTSDQQFRLASSIKRIQEIEDMIRKFDERQQSDVAALDDEETSSNKLAKTAKDWFTQYNAKRKVVIDKKRKILHKKPVPVSRSLKRQKPSPKFVNRMTHGLEAAKTRPGFLSVTKLRYSNPLAARMARSDLSNPEVFTASTKAQQKAKQISNAPENCDKRAFQLDLAKMDRASRSFGLRKCKAIDNKWEVDGIKTPLHNHQMIGASWMLEREFSDDKGGINADGMGFGKTIQTLACIVSNRPSPEDVERGCGTTLVVVPASVIKQWMSEIEEHTMKSHVVDPYLFKKSHNLPLRSLMRRDIIVTSYSEVASSYIPQKVRKFMESDDCTPEEYKRLENEHLGDLFKMHFWRVVLDEAHAIKDSKTQSYKACLELKATHRWCLTGTPVPNRTEELWAYLSFLHVSWAHSLKDFRAMIGNSKHKSNQKIFSTIQQTAIQRRTMDDTLLGKRLFLIPECFWEVKSFPLSDEEQYFYRIVEERYRAILNDALTRLRKRGISKKGSGTSLYMVFLTRLRQATAHPFLLEPVFKKTLRISDLEAIEEYLSSHGGRTSVIQQIRDWRAEHLPESSGRRDIEACDEDQFGTSQFGHTLQMNEHISKAIALKAEDTCSICYESMKDPQQGKCGCKFCSACIAHEVFRQSGGPRCPVCDKPLAHLQCINQSSFRERSALTRSNLPTSGTGETDNTRAFRERMEQARAPEIPDGRDGRSLGDDYYDHKPPLKKEFTMFLRDSDLTYPEPMVPSAKTTVVKETILGWIAEAPDDKIIIFTQFLEESQIIGRMLQAEGLTFAYYFGDLSASKKDKVIHDFHEKKEIQILVASLKCGGVALNITCANRVILTQPWWNASTELQAFCRVFRIGQLKQSHFVSLLAENTIDARMASLQVEKLESIEELFQHGKIENFEEFASLFGHLTEDEDGNLVIVPDYTDI